MTAISCDSEMLNDKPNTLAGAAEWKPSAALRKQGSTRPQQKSRALLYLAALGIGGGTYAFLGLWRDQALLGIRPALLLTLGIVVVLVLLRASSLLVRRKSKEPDKKSLLRL